MSQYYCDSQMFRLGALATGISDMLIMVNLVGFIASG